MAEYEIRNGLYTKNDCYLDPLKSLQTDVMSYALAQKTIHSDRVRYGNIRILLVPIMRGGSRPFLNISGAFRKIMYPNQESIDYVGIKASRYNLSEIGKAGDVHIDRDDINQALGALEYHDECMLIEDVFDHGITLNEVKNELMESGKPIKIMTLLRKPEESRVSIVPDHYVEDRLRKTIDGKVYPCWVVFPWEVDDHSRELWSLLYPEFASVHPELPPGQII